jgi:hypothetical protein
MAEASMADYQESNAMRIDAASPASARLPDRPAKPAEPPTQGQPQEPAPRGKAHGVVRKLGTGHYNAVAEARLTSHFGHPLPTPGPTPVDQPTDGTPPDVPVDQPDGSDQAAVPTEPVIDILA